MRRVPEGHDTTEELAASLAARHAVALGEASGAGIRRRLAKIDRSFGDAYRHLETDPKTARHPRLAEWFLDNEHLIRDSLRAVGEALPPDFYRRLPRLSAGSEPDLPRVLDLARGKVASARLQVDPERLVHMMDEYQRHRPLTIGELWALPAMLRLALLEALAGIASRTLGPGPTDEAGSADTTLLTEVASGIGSLRVIASHDWKRFVERVSRVERILRRDPARAYSGMEFESRDRYRRVVEQMARDAGGDTVDVAGWESRAATDAISLARAAALRGGTRAAHVGYYLVAEGRAELETRLGARPDVRRRTLGWILRHAGPLYTGLVSAITLIALAGLARALTAPGLAAGAASGAPVPLVVLMLLLATVPITSVGLAAVNWLASVIVPPRVLPRLDLSEGVPAEFRTVVALPVLVREAEELDAILGQLEVRYQGNADPNVRWALLTDWADGPRREMPGDEELTRRAASGVAALNSRCQEAGGAPFLLLHRRREWNPGEGLWMGWERKRGKLQELNRLLRGAEDTRLKVLAGDPDELAHVRFVITLDADTLLPPGTAARLIGTLAHPLNVPRLDDEGRVVHGYTVLQPGIETGMSSGRPSPFLRIMEADSGLDLYSNAVSDVYQDLFGEGIYAGKGIYEIDAFERSLCDRVPDNALLSHDLFEGVHGRAGLVTDVQILEECPPDVGSYMRRLHRWIRGDWQLCPWLAPTVPSRTGQRLRNDLSLLDRWKILDNLRRSLFAPTLLATLVAGWLLGVGSPWLWTLLALSVLGLPAFLGGANTLRRMIGGHRSRHREAYSSRGRFRFFEPPFRASLGRWALSLAFLPFEAFVALDAIGRTLVRLTITRRHLLEWTTAAHAARPAAQGGPGATGPALGIGREAGPRVARAAVSNLVSPLLAAVLLLALVLGRPAAFDAATALVTLWLVSPAIGRLVGRPFPEPRGGELSKEDRRFLRLVAVRTWLYFERLLTSEDHWLPPDNLQEVEGREGTVARRTSPTNLGMMFAAVLSAYDLGYIGPLELEALTLNSLETMGRLERHRGHLLNWYATGDLKPLRPRYVSTVDSGNLAAALVTLARGLDDVTRRPILRPELMRGLADTLDNAERIVGSARGATARGEIEAVRSCLRDLRERVETGAHDPLAWATLLGELGARELPQLDERVGRLAGTAVDGEQTELVRELRIWNRKVHQHVGLLQRTCAVLEPWLTHLADAPPALRSAGPDTPAGRAWGKLQRTLGAPVSPRGAAALAEAGRRLGRDLVAASGGDEAVCGEIREWVEGLEPALEAGASEARRLAGGLEEAATLARRFASEMDFRFLFDRQRGLFHIGFNVETEELDANHYDLLASEARLASYVAIAHGDVPQDHWLRLGRPLARVESQQVLLSWGATMFEYLLPNLFLRTPPRSLLGRSCRQAVRRQIHFARRRGLPWGISESGYHQLGSDASYQYRAFGVPDLGLRRGLGDRMVIAPYASLLALSLAGPEVVRNLRRLERLGLLGSLGLYEAIDYGPSPRLKLARPQLVRAYMSHHQGMALASIAKRLASRSMEDRFHAEPRMAAIEYLLHERMPWGVPPRGSWTERSRAAAEGPAVLPAAVAWPVSAASPVAETHLLSNERYTVRITETAGGGSFWKGLALTRSSPDPTLPDGGTWIYVRDLDSRDLWSAGLAPTGTRGEDAHVELSPHMAEFRRRHGGLALRLRITVPQDDDLEIRHVTLTNEDNRRRRVIVASYGEVVLAPPAEHARHPAFSKLFVQAAWMEPLDTLLFWRRPRSARDERIHLAHSVVLGAGTSGARIGCETERSAFLGRLRSDRDPVALSPGLGRPSNRAGTPLDPVFGLSCQLDLDPRRTAELAFVTAAGESRPDLLATLDFYRSFARLASASDLARQRVEMSLHDLGIDPADMPCLQTLVSLVSCPSPVRRAPPERLARVERSQPALWKHGISGDHPMVLARVGAEGDVRVVEQLLRAHRYWRARGLTADLVILDLEVSGYARPVRDRIAAALEEAGSADWLGHPGGVHVIGADACDEADVALLEASARVVLEGAAGDMRRQLREVRRPPARLPAFVPVPSAPLQPTPALPLGAARGLTFFNGTGGFTPDGREYVIRMRHGRATPAPWINVLANPSFGCLVSEAGLGCTWSENASENRLTPWRNDPVCDEPAEVLYLRDEETAEVWTPTLLPAGTGDPYEIRHGAGYTVFRHGSHGLRQRLTVFCAPDAPVKIVRLLLSNEMQRPRRITATYYAEWVLGADRARSAEHVIPEYDAETRSLLARNSFHEPFAGRVAFLAASDPPHGFTCDRNEFLGRHGNRARPAALERVGLAGAVQAGLDPCAAYMVHIDLAAGETRELHFVLGQEESREAALARVLEYREHRAVDDAWLRLADLWDGILGAVTVETPNPAMNVVLNRWLPYQTLACRLWARTATYQSSGAFGFRDQLQDVLALLDAAPQVARAHIVEAAGKQFVEGDVLHWWFPGSTTGIRTRCSDDLAWLAYVAAEYVRRTGDEGILDEHTPWITGPQLEPDEADRFGRFASRPITETVYEHCARALEKAATRGPRGLPRIGSGDWNDGMNQVGEDGRGESVWLGWFLIAALSSFGELAARRGDAARVRFCTETAESYRGALEESAWDGEWYVRAFYDDGRPLGSATDREARIDSISQAWAVLSGGARPERAAKALESVNRLLVDDDERLVRLLAPPFDHTERNPGYIKGYPPGVRENGGQYTHAAAWVAWAFAALGDAERAVRLFDYLNPVLRATTAEDAARYGVEPYVAAADVYGVPPFAGRGGWTWYTGSAAWLYRLGLEAILGIRREGDRLRIEPRIPATWPGYEARFRFGSSTYAIRVENAAGRGAAVREVEVDGAIVPAAVVAGNSGTRAEVALAEDGREHEIVVRLGAGS